MTSSSPNPQSPRIRDSDVIDDYQGMPVNISLHSLHSQNSQAQQPRLVPQRSSSFTSIPSYPFNLPSSPLGSTYASSLSSSASSSSSSALLERVSSLESALNNIRTEKDPKIKALETEIKHLKSFLATLSSSPQTILSSSPSPPSTSSTSPSPSAPITIPSLVLSSSPSSTATHSTCPLSPSSSSSNYNEEMVILNVGGEKFSTTRTTLRKHDDSMLAKLFSGRYRVNRDSSDGSVFIDRSPLYFPTVLNYLRGNHLRLPEKLSDLIELEAEFMYYHLPFPDDVFLRFASCYALERIIGEPPLLPEFWEVRSGLLLCSEYREIEYITYLIDVHSGQRVGKIIDLLSLKISKDFQCGLTGRGLQVWTFHRDQARVLIVDMMSGNFDIIQLDELEPTIQWRSCSVLPRCDVESNNILAFCDESESNRKKLGWLLHLDTKRIVKLASQKDKSIHLWPPLVFGDVLVVLMKPEGKEAETTATRYLCAWNINSGTQVYELQSLNLRKLKAGDHLVHLDGRGVGFIADPQTGTIVGSFNAANLQQTLGRKLKVTDAITCLGHYMVIWPRDSGDLLIFEMIRDAPITHLRDALPYSNSGSMAHLSYFGQRLIACCSSPNQVMVISPSHVCNF